MQKIPRDMVYCDDIWLKESFILCMCFYYYRQAIIHFVHVFLLVEIIVYFEAGLLYTMGIAADHTWHAGCTNLVNLTSTMLTDVFCIYTAFLTKYFLCSSEQISCCSILTRIRNCEDI